MKSIIPILLSSLFLFAKPLNINFAMVISGGVSLGAYEAGYNWAMVKMLRYLENHSNRVHPNLKSLAGASAGSINALLSGIYWCQKESAPLHNSVNDNLFYNIWTGIDITNLQIVGDDPTNSTTLFTREPLQKAATSIIEHMQQPIYRRGCSIPLGVMVTKSHPIQEEFDGIHIKTQSFAIPMRLKEQAGALTLKENSLKNDLSATLKIPQLNHDLHTITDILFASSAFPGAFEKVKLDYIYNGKRGSDYFLDGGVYNNIPLDLAMAQADNINYYLFIDPDSRRYYHKRESNCSIGTLKRFQKKETKSSFENNDNIGFLGSNILPLMHSTHIFRSMKLYETINRYFRHNPNRHLILSSRYHPITGNFLWNFGAFLDKNFREYDYYVGVYDAIYKLAEESIKRGFAKGKSITQEMDRFATILALKKSPDAYSAYKLFKEIEFCAKLPKQKSRFAAIYRAFNLPAHKKDLYSFKHFNSFIQKLDISNFKIAPDSFLAYAKKYPNSWYKKSAQELIDRVVLLENKRAQQDVTHAPIARVLGFSAWVSSGLLTPKDGLQLQPLHFPNSNSTLDTLAYKIVPSEFAFDTINGGLSLGYSLYWYKKSDLFDGVEFKLSFNSGKHIDNFLRLDIDPFINKKAFTYGAGASIFANLQGKKRFWDPKSAFGANIYVDYNDIFRLTYVRRFGEAKNRDYFYFGIKNLSSLYYWLNR